MSASTPSRSSGLPAAWWQCPSFPKIDYHKLLDFAPWAFGLCLLALVAVKLVGHKVLGARRWIKVGPMHFQPSEWVKLVLILLVARYFANLGGRSSPGRTFSKPLRWSACRCCWC